MQIPWTPPGCAEPLATESGPPPLEDVDALVGIPQGGLARPNLFRSNADDCHQEHLDGRAGIPI